MRHRNQTNNSSYGDVMWCINRNGKLLPVCVCVDDMTTMVASATCPIRVRLFRSNCRVNLFLFVQTWVVFKKVLSEIQVFENTFKKVFQYLYILDFWIMLKYLFFKIQVFLEKKLFILIVFRKYFSYLWLILEYSNC